MIAPELFKPWGEFVRPPFDPDLSKKLLERSRLSGRFRGGNGLPE